MVASSSMPLFPHLAEMNDEEKYSVIARFIPCDRCSQCKGWHPYDSSNETNCQCGHDTFHHIDNGQDLDRRLKVALRLTELLEEKGKIEDYDYEDEDILSLKKQILYNALPESNQVLKRNRDSTIGEEEDDDDDEEEEEEEEDADHDLKRLRTKDKENHFESEMEEHEDEEDEEDEEDDDEEDESEEEEEVDSEKSDEEEEEEDEDEEDDEEEDNEMEKDNANSLQIKDAAADQVDIAEVDLQPKNIEINGLDPRKEDQITNGIEKNVDIETENTTLATENADLATEDMDMGTVAMDDDQSKDENNIKREDTITPDILENGIEINGTEKEEDIVGRMIRELMPVEKKESPAMIEEREGDIQVQVVLNDGARQSMILLTGLKNIFQKQLPKMPKEYIARLVYDRNHRSIALIRSPHKVIGGICYRPFDTQEFAEIVFCAVASTEQVKGYGSFIMNHLKDYVSGHTNVKHFLTYADNYAVGYFRKQGFTTEITLDKRKWVGYIKDYEGGTIMQCTMVPQVKYLRVQDILGVQRNAILKKIQEQSTEHITYPGIRMPIDKSGKRSTDPLEVPGIAESGWTPEMDMLSNRPRHSPYYNQMLHIVEEMQNYTHAWPFLEPVSIEDVADYYDIIKDPMDLATLEDNVKADAYPTMEEFVQDTQKIFENCKLYNAEDTEYARCSAKLERFFNEKLRAAKRSKQEQS